MDKKHHIVEGEASESDEDDKPIRNVDESKNNSIDQQGQSGIVGRQQRTVVSGEASESDEEIDTSELGTKLQIDTSVPPNFSTQTGLGSKEHLSSVKSEVRIRPKYGSVLHWKLVEKNSDFRRNLCESIGQVYITSAKEIKNTSIHSTKAQLAVQDISHTMRLLTNDLFHLEDKLDIIVDSKLLPSVKINVP